MTDENARPWDGRFPPNEIISLLDVNRPHNLAESTSRNLLLSEVVGLLGGYDAIRDLELGYGTSAGLPALRAAIAAAHGVTADDVVTTQGTALGMFLLGFELCRNGDRALLTLPCFPPTRDALTACGVAIDPVVLRFDDGYRIAPGAIADRLTTSTRLVMLASPQNPSGIAAPADVVRAILDAMTLRAPRAYLFVDETYRIASHGDRAVPASMAGSHPRVIVGSSVSKAHGAPGLRVGWLITSDRELRDRLIVAKLNTVISGSVLDEALAVGILTAGDGPLASRRAQLGRALESLESWLATERGRVEWVRPDGGALCCLRLRADAFDRDAIDRFWSVLPSHDLQLAAGTWFGDPDGARVFRLGFGFLPEGSLVRALAALSAAMDRVLAPGPAHRTPPPPGSI